MILLVLGLMIVHFKISFVRWEKISSRTSTGQWSKKFIAKIKIKTCSHSWYHDKKTIHLPHLACEIHGNEKKTKFSFFNFRIQSNDVRLNNENYEKQSDSYCWSNFRRILESIMTLFRNWWQLDWKRLSEELKLNFY